MISPAALEKYGKRLVFIRWEPGRMNWIPGIRPFCEGEKIRGLLAARIAQTGRITWRPVADNNTRAAMLQTGKRSLLSPFPTSRPHCWRKTKYRVDGQSVNYAALYQYERDEKPFDNPKVREALNYAINRPRW